MSRRAPVLRLAAVALAAVATAALTQSTAGASFAGTTGNAGDKVSSAATFCSTAPTTVLSAGDSWTDEANTSANHYDDLNLYVRSSSAGDRRHTWIRFDLPAVPARCDLVQAKLSFYATASAAGRNIDVYRANPAATPWASTTIWWGDEPTVATPPATNAVTTGAPGWQQWTVTALVQAQYPAGANNGFLLRDRVENAGTAQQQVYYDRQNATYYPRLVLTWG